MKLIETIIIVILIFGSIFILQAVVSFLYACIEKLFCHNTEKFTKIWGDILEGMIFD